MRIESNSAPLHQFKLEYDGDLVDVLFYENVEVLKPEPGDPGLGQRQGKGKEQEQEPELEETAQYRFDMYRIKGVRNREGLAARIEENFKEWVDLAKALEQKELSDAIRCKRNALLAETDWTQIADAPLSKSEIEAYRIYRQELRDVPEQRGFLLGEIEWPMLTASRKLP